MWYEISCQELHLFQVCNETRVTCQVYHGKWTCIDSTPINQMVTFDWLWTPSHGDKNCWRYELITLLIGKDCIFITTWCIPMKRGHKNQFSLWVALQQRTTGTKRFQTVFGKAAWSDWWCGETFKWVVFRKDFIQSWGKCD